MCGRFTVLTYDEVEGVVRSLEYATPVNLLPDWPARGASPLAGGTPGGSPTRPEAGPQTRPEARPGSTAWVIAPVAPQETGAGRLPGRSPGQTPGRELGQTAGQTAVRPIRLAPIPLTWGFPVEWSKRPVINTRIETALGPNPGMWRDAVRHGRCVVPAARFFEPHATETEPSPRTGRPMKRQYAFASPDGRPLLMAAVSDRGRFSIVTTEPCPAVAPVHDRMPLLLLPDEVGAWLGDGFPALADRSRFELAVAPERAERTGQAAGAAGAAGTAGAAEAGATGRAGGGDGTGGAGASGEQLTLF